MNATSNAPRRSGPPDPGRKESLGRKLGISFAQVVSLAAVVCAVLLVALLQVAGSVRQMQHDESAIRGSFDLANAIREQYIHAAHTIVVADASHLDHYTGWVVRVREETEALRGLVSERHRWRLDRIDRRSAAADRVFWSELLPAVLRGDDEAMRASHDEIEGLVSVAAQDADTIARSVEERMASEHMDTTHLTYVAVLVVVAGLVTLAAFAVVSTRGLRTLLLRPLRAAAAAAQRIGSGDFDARMDTTFYGELGVVARAFNGMAQELREHERRLVKTERMAAIGELAAGVAHEINNPIGVIRGYLRTMIPEADRPALREELRILDEEAAACQRIAEDLVAYARSPEPSRASCDVAEILRQVRDRFAASGEAKSATIHVRAESHSVDLDPVRVRQLIDNLVRNAVQASPSAGRIDVEGTVDGDAYAIRVRDRGDGIPPELQKRIFEPFVSGRPNGTGLGLAVCHGIVRSHGGTIEALDREGGGTVVEVRLPLAQKREVA